MRPGKRQDLIFELELDLLILWLVLFAANSAAQSFSQPAAPSRAGSYQSGNERPENRNDSPVPLTNLIQEAERGNPEILAARHAWKATAQMPSQVSTLPDPQFTVQQFAVGSPRPNFAKITCNC
jgi:hypothetical protein